MTDLRVLLCVASSLQAKGHFFSLSTSGRWPSDQTLPRVHHSSRSAATSVSSLHSAVVCLQLIWWAHFGLLYPILLLSDHDWMFGPVMTSVGAQSNLLAFREEAWHSQLLKVLDVGTFCLNETMRNAETLDVSWHRAGSFPFRNNLLTWISTLCLDQISSWDVSKLGFLGHESKKKSLWYQSDRVLK